MEYTVIIFACVCLNLNQILSSYRVNLESRGKVWNPTSILKEYTIVFVCVLCILLLKLLILASPLLPLSYFIRVTYAMHTLILPWIINHEYCFDLNSFMPHWYKSYKLYHRSHTVITNNTYHIPLLGLNEHLVSTMKYFKNLSSSSLKNLDDVVRKRFEIDEKKRQKFIFRNFFSLRTTISGASAFRRDRMPRKFAKGLRFEVA